MKVIADKARKIQEALLMDIDHDSDAYNVVFDAFKLPKTTEGEKKNRSLCRDQEPQRLPLQSPWKWRKSHSNLSLS